MNVTNLSTAAFVLIFSLSFQVWSAWSYAIPIPLIRKQTLIHSSRNSLCEAVYTGCTIGCRPAASIVLSQNAPELPGRNLFDFAVTVIGEPRPLMRHRVARGIVYNPSGPFQKSFHDACATYFPSKPFDGALEAHLSFHFSRPKSHFRSVRKDNVLSQGEVKASAPKCHTSRKDLDNLVKFVLDALNKKVYLDDGQITVIVATKAFTAATEPPRIEVGIRKIGV